MKCLFTQTCKSSLKGDNGLEGVKEEEEEEKEEKEKEEEEYQKDVLQRI